MYRKTEKERHTEAEKEKIRRCKNVQTVIIKKKQIIERMN